MAESYGIQKDFGKGMLIGIALAVGFIILNKIVPNFALGFPSLPASIADNLKAVIIIVLAPVLEEAFFNKAILETLQIRFKLSYVKANVYKSLLFASFHTLAYGIYLNSIEKLSVLVGTFGAVSGLFITAFLFSLLAGYLLKKYKNLLITIIAHGIINGYLFVTALAIFSIG